jgi:flagellar hook-associated protein 3 FlgL
MRITYNYLVESVLNGFQNNAAKLQSLQEKLSSGKNIASPDQGPVETAKILAFKTKESQTNQYVENIDEAISWLTFSENSVSQINTSISRMRELALASINGSLPQSSKESAILELEQIKNKLISDGNNQILNKYIFSGNKTLTKPFTESAGTITYNGNSESLKREISFDSSIDINISGDKIYNMGGSVNPSDPNLFEVADNLISTLKADNVGEISNTIIGQIDRASDNVINIYSGVGAKVNRLELTKEQHGNNLTMIQTMLSNLEDIDIAKVVMDLKKANQIYQISLEVAGRVFPQSLLDYLQ